MALSRIPSVLLAGMVAIALLSDHANAQETTTRDYTLKVDGLACPFCAYGIEKQLNKIEGIENIDIDIETGTITLTTTGGATIEEPTARKAVEAAGFTLRDFESSQ